MFDPAYLAYIFRDHQFTFQGEQFSSADVLSERGFLPVIAYYADETSKWLFQGMGIGLEVYDDSVAMLGQRAEFLPSDETGVPDSIRAPLLLHSALEVLGVGLEPQLVNLDPLYERLVNGEPICAPAV